VLENIKQIIRHNDLAVLATCLEDRPHCSLMAYISNQECTLLHMLTLKDSRKFYNISRNPQVSLLIDTRLLEKTRKQVQALTISGNCSRAPGREEPGLKNELLKRHPQLQDLASQEAAVVLQVRIASFLLLTGVSSPCFIDVSGS